MARRARRLYFWQGIWRPAKEMAAIWGCCLDTARARAERSLDVMRVYPKES